MSEDPESPHKMNSFYAFFHRVEASAVMTFLGVVLLFSSAIGVTLIAPRYVDPTWTEPSSIYQVQMYEVADPNTYISSSMTGGTDILYLHHIQDGYTLLAFPETEVFRIVAPPELEKYITRYDDPILKLTSRLLLLRKPKGGGTSFDFDAAAAAQELLLKLRSEDQHLKSSQTTQASNDKKTETDKKIEYDIYELYVPEGSEAFSISDTGGILEEWVDSNFTIIDEQLKQSYHASAGVIYVNNPKEFRVSVTSLGDKTVWDIDHNGEKVQSVEQLRGAPFGFRSRQELIKYGERIYAREGCWYCHTDQTRTLVQDVVLNGSESFPAPPSSPNEYIYQEVTFPGTRRIGPDISRVGVKKPSRDWHKAHFWSPKTSSRGSIMPSFRHFFDADPRGTGKQVSGVPNHEFEAIFQYMMTKGTRITPPTQAWWLGKDPVQTIEIIEGRKK